MKDSAYHIHVEMPVDWRFGRDILGGLLAQQRASKFRWGVTCHLWQQEEVWTLQKDQSPDVVVGLFYDTGNARRWLDQGVRVVNIAGIDREIEGLHTVTVDNLDVGRLAAEHFLERGFKSFAYVRDRRTPAAKQRAEGFHRTIGTELPLPTHGRLEPQGMAEFLQTLPPATAIFCFTDAVARYVITVLQQLQKTVPEEYAVMGVNADPIDGDLSPVALSSIDIRPYEIGRQAAVTINDLLNGHPCPKVQLLPPGEVITRRSTDILALDDPSVAALLHRIRDRACERIRVADLLKPSDGSRRALEIKFKKLLGRTIEEEIRRCRLATARDMLLYTKLNINQIADACGFSNTPHFSRAFKEAHGVSPGAYRR